MSSRKPTTRTSSTRLQVADEAAADRPAPATRTRLRPSSGPPPASGTSRTSHRDSADERRGRQRRRRRRPPRGKSPRSRVARTIAYARRASRCPRRARRRAGRASSRSATRAGRRRRGRRRRTSCRARSAAPAWNVPRWSSVPRPSTKSRYDGEERRGHEHAVDDELDEPPRAARRSRARSRVSPGRPRRSCSESSARKLAELDEQRERHEHAERGDRAAVVEHVVGERSSRRAPTAIDREQQRRPSSRRARSRRAGATCGRVPPWVTGRRSTSRTTVTSVVSRIGIASTSSGSSIVATVVPATVQLAARPSAASAKPSTWLPASPMKTARRLARPQVERAGSRGRRSASESESDEHEVVRVRRSRRRSRSRRQATVASVAARPSMLSSRLKAFVIPTSQTTAIATRARRSTTISTRRPAAITIAGRGELRGELRERAQMAEVVDEPRDEEQRAAREDARAAPTSAPTAPTAIASATPAVSPQAMPTPPNVGVARSCQRSPVG